MRLLNSSSHFVITLLVAIILTACSAQYRMNHLLRTHPELAKVDTIVKVVSDTVKGFSNDFSFGIDTTAEAVNPVLPVIPEKIIQKKNYYGIFLKDTLTQIQNGVTVKLFQNGSKIGVIVIKPDEVREKQVPIIIQKVDQNPCEHHPTWFDYVAYSLAGLCLVMVGFLIYVK